MYHWRINHFQCSKFKVYLKVAFFHIVIIIINFSSFSYYQFYFISNKYLLRSAIVFYCYILVPIIRTFFSIVFPMLHSFSKSIDFYFAYYCYDQWTITSYIFALWRNILIIDRMLIYLIGLSWNANVYVNINFYRR